MAVHHAVGFVPFFNTEAFPGLYLAATWALTSLVSAYLVRNLFPEERQLRFLWGWIAIGLFWVVMSFEFYPFLKQHHLSNRWVAVPWILYGLGVWWLGCWQKRIEWRGPGVVLVLFSTLRCVLGDLPTDRTTPFIPLFDQASLPIVLTALLLGSARPFFKRYAAILTNEERKLGLFAGFAAIACSLSSCLWIRFSIAE